MLIWLSTAFAVGESCAVVEKVPKAFALESRVVETGADAPAEMLALGSAVPELINDSVEGACALSAPGWAASGPKSWWICESLSPMPLAYVIKL